MFNRKYIFKCHKCLIFNCHVRFRGSKFSKQFVSKFPLLFRRKTRCPVALASQHHIQQESNESKINFRSKTSCASPAGNFSWSWVARPVEPYKYIVPKRWSRVAFWLLWPRHGNGTQAAAKANEAPFHTDPGFNAPLVPSREGWRCKP